MRVFVAYHIKTMVVEKSNCQGLPKKETVEKKN